jgi:site-specific recombinase XerD
VTPIAPHITAFLQQRLPIDQACSPNTCDTYAYTFQLLFKFMSCKLGAAPSDLQLEQLDAPMVLDFLEHLQRERRNSANTRNARLAAVRSFMRFIEYRVPSALDQVRRVRAIPSQKTDKRLVRHLNDDEYHALIDSPDPCKRSGIRDRAMLIVALTAGLRVSDLIGLRVDDIQFNGPYMEIHVRGKGRRERAMILWKSVADAVRAWLAVRGDASTPELFLNAWGKHLSRSGFECVLAKHIAAAATACSSLRNKRVSPHVLRHTCAFTTLQATRDIRKVSLWLGHASTLTTDIYLQSDPTEKLEALAALKIPNLRPGKFRPSDRLLASLRPSTVMRSSKVTKH